MSLNFTPFPPEFTSENGGIVPPSPGGTTTYLRADGQWATPAGGGGGGSGTVTTVSVVNANGFAGSVANAGSTPAITLQTTVSGMLKGNGAGGIVAATEGVDFISENQTITLSGDATGSGATSIAVTLATINSNVGTFGSATTVPVVSVDAKGRVTGVTAEAIDLPNPTYTVSGDVSGTLDGGTDTLTLATVNAGVGTFGNGTSIPVVTVNAKGLITAVSTTPLAASYTITGDVTGTVDGGTDLLSLATVNAAPQTDTFRKVTVNGKGLVTATSAVTEADVTGTFTSKPVNTFFAAPSSGSGVPSFRAIVAGDVPTLNQNTTGSAGSLTTGRTFSVSGDATGTSGSFDGTANATIPVTIGNGVVTNAKMADMANNTFKGRNAGSTGIAQDLTATQATAMLDLFSAGAKGLAPATGGATLTFLRADGTWATPSTPEPVNEPGGGFGNVVYWDLVNEATTKSDGLAWDDTTKSLIISNAAQTDGGLIMTGLRSNPPAPPTSTGGYYARELGTTGQTLPYYMGPSGVGYQLQSSLIFNRYRAWVGGATTTATTFAGTVGVMPYTGASPTAPTIVNPTATDLLTSINRSRISTGATGGALAYIRGNSSQVRRGAGSDPNAGFFMTIRFAVTGTLQAGLRCFAGLVGGSANPTNIDPVTTNAVSGVGLAIAANSGNWQFVHNAGGVGRTAVDLGANFAINNSHLLELILFAAPNAANFGYVVSNISTGNSVTGTATTNLPGAGNFLTPSVWITNNATAAAQTLDFVQLAITTDY